jgi:hypothetical protein
MQLYTGAQINFGDLTPYLNYEYGCAHEAQINFGDLTPYLTYISKTVEPGIS